MSKKSPFVVSAEWLVKHLKDPGLSIIDGSWYLPAQNRDARNEYDQAHIPGAVFFDHDEVVDPDSALPHALPSPSTFEQHVSAMGINREDTIVVYDGPGMFTAPRVWWMFRVMGADKVFILDGGIDNWKANGHIVTDKPTKIAPTAFVPKPDLSRVATFSDMSAIVGDPTFQIADARSPGRFSGEEPEPRTGVRSGHMPGARNVPVMTLSNNGYLKDLESLRKTLEQAGVDPNRPVVTTCGSGVTAAVISLALESLGAVDHRLYDGSWSEWGMRDDTPVETGPPKT
ncbi:3-mercaptopyruvate sulfurtransferase [Oricola cellulosilytica]|uniref:3-mercaptopyruvate sulfurtransferase n=1 Tax=Oricola cellulosilytica TaxID=1429082 RepID=A0A4R0P9I7_9HYPH|nr:3-mercaptopyruvate sulfurtransferase [Oricola cellulosilytica]TCD12328.1 3-mercaptopyruvate sulfurtransferase [Oricola cellulosilytica]